MLRKLLSTIACVLFVSASAFAQGTLMGTVTDAQSGEPLPGVNVLIEEMQRGTATGPDGEFTINGIPYGNYTLVATFIGYQRYNTQITIDSEEQTSNISLQPDVIGLEDVVVTAQGIQREKRALGYSVSSVESKDLENKGQADVTRALKGKVPGVNITQTSGVSGTATDFVIRGYTTLTGSNQPLFIVDGVRFNTSTNSGQESFTDGGSLSTSSRFLDLDPNNIESVSVLKGLSATTVYGEQGRNGVVLITTKNGSFSEDREPGFEVTLDQSFYANTIASLPDYQDNYGGGFHQNFGYFFSNWGPRFDSDQLPTTPNFLGFDDDGFAQFPHPYSQFSSPDLIAAFPQFQGQPFSYRPYDNVGPFFNTGVVGNTSLNISGGTQDVNLNLSVGLSDEEGFTPGNNLIKNNVGLGANFKVFEGLTVSTTANVALTDMETPPIGSSFGSSASTSGGGSIFGDVFYTPRSVDLNGLPFQNPVTGGSVYYRSGNDIENPRWVVENIKRTDNVDRLFGKAEANYQVLPELSVSYKLGLDTYSENQSYRLNQGGVNNPSLQQGYYHTRNIQQTIWDHNFYLTYKKDLNDQFSLDGLVGAQFVLDKFEADGIGSQNQIIFDLFEHGNFTSPSATNALNGAEFQFRSREETAGVFLDATLGYEDWIYLNLSGRNDWFSTLEPDNRSIFYPSASVSFIPTEVFDFGGNALNYLKVRAGVGTSAGAPNPYNTRSTLASSARRFVNFGGTVITTNAISDELGNRDLKPELHTEYELGIESKLWNNRIGLDVTVYTRITTDLITSADLDPSTGFEFTSVNIGELQNRGLEIALNGSPITGDFQWNTRFNFYAYESEVTDLSEDLTEIAVAGFTNLGNFAIEGEPLNIMQGTRIARDEQGRRLVDENGDYIQDGQIGIIGDPNPDWSLSGINTFNYKNFSLTAQVDYTQGGDVYSTFIGTLLARGISTDTDFDRQVPVILPGFKENGEPNDVQISATQAYFTNIGFGPDEVSVFDATNIRLSELSLSYNLPVSILSKTPLKQVSLTLSGFNLWYFAFNVPKGTNFDPNVSGTGADNGLGFDFLAGPSARRYGGSLRVKF